MLHHSVLAQATQIGDQLLQGLETARTTDPIVLVLIGILAVVVVIVIIAATGWRKEGSNGQVTFTLTKLIDDLRTERQEADKRQDEKDELHRQTILQITTAHQQETEKQTSALSMQIDILTGMSTSSQAVEHGIEEITKTVAGINPETRLIADNAHTETRKVIIESLTTAIEALAKDLSSQVDTLRESIRAANENTYQVFSEDGALTQILVSLQSILSILKTQEKNINATSLSDLISGTADSAGSNGNGRCPDHSAGSDGGKPVSDSGSDPAGTAGDTGSNPGGQPGTE